MITSKDNPRVKRWAKLAADGRFRRRERRAIVEGPHLVALADPLVLLAGESGLKRREIQDLLAGREAIVLADKVFRAITDAESPQGVAAEIEIPEPGPVVAPAAFLEGVQDPGNVGTILRTLDAVGADALFLLDGGVELYHPTVVRSSMGTIFWKTIIQTSFDEFVTWARQGQYQLIGASAHADVDYQTLVPDVPWILVLGSEQKGLGTEQSKVCDVTVSLPMRGRVSSLNLAVAAGVLLYRFVNQ